MIPGGTVRVRDLRPSRDGAPGHYIAGYGEVTRVRRAGGRVTVWTRNRGEDVHFPVTFPAQWEGVDVRVVASEVTR